MDELLLLAGCVCAAGSVVALTQGLPPLLGARTSRILQERERTHQQILQELFIRDVTPRQIEWMAAGGAALLAFVVLLATDSIFLALLLGASVLLLPGAIFGYLRTQRRARFDEQLPDALAVLANSTRAGMSINQAIEQVATRSAAPLADEMSLILQEIRLGTDLGKSIDDARERIGSRNFGLVATSLQVNRDKGGNLPEALDTMASSLKEIWRLEQRLITASAEGRKATWLISGMPVVIFGMITLFQPDIARTLVSNIAGIAVLVIALAFYVGGLLWLRRVLQVDA